jgi:hypothetical protein
MAIAAVTSLPNMLQLKGRCRASLVKASLSAI